MEDDSPQIDLEALDSYLFSDFSPDECMMLSNLDGFLTGIVICPESIPPIEWLPVIWGGDKAEFESVEQMQTIISTIMGRYSEIVVPVTGMIRRPASLDLAGPVAGGIRRVRRRAPGRAWR